MKIIITAELLARFWSKIESLVGKTGFDCWNWIGGTDKDGYGKIYITIRRGFRIKFSSHRLSYIMFKGNLKHDLFVCHSCDNPSCINPFHLEAKIVLENNRDSAIRNRHYNKLVTHCPRGHEYNKENTYLSKDGSRSCRICRKLCDRKYTLTGSINNILNEQKKLSI